MTKVKLQGVASTLLVPLACRAIESARPDAILLDQRAEEIFKALGADRGFLMGMGSADMLVTVMRACQFDKFAREFISREPNGIVVDLGCGLDTRFDRLDNGEVRWVGIDLPEVIDLRRQYLPDTDRSRTIAQSMLETSWLDLIEAYQRTPIFLAEGVFPYFSSAEIKPMVQAMVECFPGGELVFDAASPFISRHHNRTSSVLKRTGTRILWDVRNPGEVEKWGLVPLHHWYYFDDYQPRLGKFGWMKYIPFISKSTGVYHFRLRNAPSTPKPKEG